jgi:hypothetical protein
MDREDTPLVAALRTEGFEEGAYGRWVCNGYILLPEDHPHLTAIPLQNIPILFMYGEHLWRVLNPHFLGKSVGWVEYMMFPFLRARLKCGV